MASLFNLTGFVNVVIGGAMRNLTLVQQQANRTARGLTNNMAQIESSSIAATNAMSRAFLAMGAVFAAKVGGDALKKLADFDDKMRSVNTLAKLGTTEFNKFSNTIANFSAENKLATSATENAVALYEIYSANVLRGTTATENMIEAQVLLKEASMAATGGLTTTKTAVDIMTTVMNTYGKEAGSISDINDVLFKTVELGKVSYAELANSMSFVLGQATANKVSFRELSAIMATLTDKGQSASIAARELRTMIGAVTNPSKAAKEAMARYGFYVDQTTLSNEGLVATIKKVVTATNGNAAAMKAIFRENTAVTAATLLATNNFELLDDAVSKLNGNLEGTALGAYEEKMKSLNNQWNTFKVQIEALVLTYGSKLTPTLTQGMTLLTNFVKSINEADPVTQDLIVSTTKAALGFAAFVGAIAAVQAGLRVLIPTLRLIVSPLVSLAGPMVLFIRDLRYLTALGPAGAAAARGLAAGFAASAASAGLLAVAVGSLITLLGVYAATLHEQAKEQAVLEDMHKKDQEALKGISAAYKDANMSAKEFIKTHKDRTWAHLAEDIISVRTAMSQAKNRIKEIESYGGQITVKGKEEIDSLQLEIKLLEKKMDALLNIKAAAQEAAAAGNKTLNPAETHTADGKWIDLEARAKNEAARNRKLRRDYIDKLRDDPNPKSQEMVQAFDKEDLEHNRQTALNNWTEFLRKKSAGHYRSAQDEYTAYMRVFKQMWDARLGVTKDQTGKIVDYETEEYAQAAAMYKDIHGKAVQEKNKNTIKRNKEIIAQELSDIEVLANAKKISYEQEIVMLQKVLSEKRGMTTETERQINEKIAQIKGAIIVRDEKAAKEKLETEINAINQQARAFGAMMKTEDAIIERMQRQGATAAEINAHLEKRLELTLAQINLEEQAGLKAAKSEEEKEAVRAEADANRQQALTDHGAKQEQVNKKEADQLSKEADSARELNQEKLGQIDIQRKYLDIQESKGKDVSRERVALLKKENDIAIANIKSETENKIRERDAEGATDIELTNIKALGEERINNILEQQKLTIQEILQAEKERNKSPIQTTEEAISDINAQMGLGQGSFGTSNLGGSGAFSSRVRKLNGNIKTSPLTSPAIAPNVVGPFSEIGSGMLNSVNSANDTSRVGKTVKNVSRPTGQIAPGTEITQKVKIEIDVNGKIKVAEGKLSEVTANGFFTETGAISRLQGSDPSRNGRQV